MRTCGNCGATDEGSGRQYHWEWCPMVAPNPAATPQPAPEPSNQPAVVDLVLTDLRARDIFGLRKYGTRLQAHNGRDALMDAYQEGLDLVIYLRQAIAERDAAAAASAVSDLSPGDPAMARNIAKRMRERAKRGAK